MTATDTAGLVVVGPPIITRREVAAINAARRALKAIEERAARTSWDGPPHVARDLGRLAGVADACGDLCFDVLNVASAYCDSPQARKGLHL